MRPSFMVFLERRALRPLMFLRSASYDFAGRVEPRVC